MTLDFNDFQKQDVKFNIKELQKAYNDIIKIKNFDGPIKIFNFYNIVICFLQFFDVEFNILFLKIVKI